jgi:glycosyltransferase involved in cell wall biosynthesis
MKISVVIPLYNKAPTILRAIVSVLGQRHYDLELIVVDDGSTDDSLAKIAQIEDERLKIFRQRNKGVSAARNAGASIACSDWIAFLDADDEYHPDFLYRCAELIDAHKGKDISFIASNYLLMNYLSDASHQLAFNERDIAGEVVYLELSKGHRTPACSSSVVVNRRKFQKIGGFPEDIRYFEDWTLWLKLSWSGKFLFISDPLSFIYRDESGASFHSRVDTMDFFKCALAMVRVMDGQLNNCHIDDSQRNLVALYRNWFLICQSSILARRKACWASIKLLTKLTPQYLRPVRMFQVVHVLALNLRTLLKWR